MNTARAALLSHPPFSSSPSSLAVHSLVPEEPDKPVVLAWRPGDPLPTRAASVVACFRGRTHLLTVDDLQAPSGAGRVSSHLELDDSTSGYPTLTIEDMTSATSAPFSDGAFNRTILARGVRLADVACLPMSTGWFGAAEESRRRIKVQCYSAEGTANFYMRPIEGLTVLLDMDTLDVVSISDRGRYIPIPQASGTDYRYASGGEAAFAGGEGETHIHRAAEGPSFTVEGGGRGGSST